MARGPINNNAGGGGSLFNWGRKKPSLEESVASSYKGSPAILALQEQMAADQAAVAQSNAMREAALNAGKLQRAEMAANALARQNQPAPAAKVANAVPAVPESIRKFNDRESGKGSTGLTDAINNSGILDWLTEIYGNGGVTSYGGDAPQTGKEQYLNGSNIIPYQYNR